jgi:nitrogen regulatory protein PII
MKLIEAYIPPDALEQVRELLFSQGLEDLFTSDTATEILEDERARRQSPEDEFIPQLKLQVAVSDDRAMDTARQILNKVGQRQSACIIQIVIGHLDEVVRIGTGERGLRAL